jgi:hypothetical protein
MYTAEDKIKKTAKQATEKSRKNERKKEGRRERKHDQNRTVGILSDAVQEPACYGFFQPSV